MAENKELLQQTVIKLFEKVNYYDNEIDDDFVGRLLNDIEISAALDKVERAVAGRELKVTTDDIALQDQAEEIEKRFSSVKFNRILNHLITARYWGYSCFEIVYKEDFTIQSLIPIPHEYVIRDTDGKWKVKVGTNEIEMTREKFLLAIHKWNPASPRGQNIFKSFNKSFLDKELFDSQLRGLAKKYGDVIVVIPYNPGLPEEEVKKMGKEVAEAKGKDVVAVPIDKRHQTLKDNFAFIKLSDLDPSIYVQLSEREKEKIVQKILGGTLTIDNGDGKGSYSLGQVHQDGLNDVVQEVCNFAEDSLYQLIQIDAGFYGYNPEEFYWSLNKVVSEDEEQEKEKKKSENMGLKLDNLLKLNNAGYSFTPEKLSEYLGVAINELVEVEKINNFNPFGHEFAKDTVKKKNLKLFETQEQYDKFESYIKEKMKDFTSDIKRQIIEQLKSIKEGGEFTLDLDYSKLKDDFILTQLKSYTNAKSILYGNKISDFNPFNMKFEDAIKSFLDKTPLLFESIEEITEEVVSNFIWIKKSTDLEITKKLFDNMQSNLKEGGTLKEWIKNSETLIDKLGLGDQGYYLENVYRTNIFTQYSIGNYKQLMESAKDFPYWKYHSVIDNRTSDICKQLNGKIYRYDNAFWSMYYPPNHYQCRATVIPYSTEEIRELGLKTSRVTTNLEIDDLGDFKGNPAKVYWKHVKANAEGKQRSFKWE